MSWRAEHGFGLDAAAKADAATAEEGELDAPDTDVADGEAA